MEDKDNYYVKTDESEPEDSERFHLIQSNSDPEQLNSVSNYKLSEDGVGAIVESP